MFEPQAEAKGLNFTLTYKTAMPHYVVTDEKRLRQILINLLSNAIKYTHQGGVEFNVRYRNQVAEFTIADTGIGIPESEHERIFKPFERILLPGAPQVMGTGLGLTITRLLVDIMGGELRLETNYDKVTKAPKGTVFCVSLMLSSIHSPAANPIQKVVYGFKGKAKNILVLDDDPFHRALIFETLTPLGFSVFEAPDILTAQHNIELSLIDLFILDVNMPNSSGWDFANSLRAQNIQAPIIMVSADADEGKRPPQEPHNDYLVKPIKIPALLDAIQNQLNIIWQYQAPLAAPTAPQNNNQAANKILKLPLKELETALHYAENGHLKGLKDTLAAINNASLTQDLKPLIEKIELNKIIRYLELKINDASSYQ
jgi:CheY-like chemotaxis protein/anti-sigma regulatory factor (Ser/Thr protein kinase)